MPNHKHKTQGLFVWHRFNSFFLAELKKARGELQDLEATYSSQLKLAQETAAAEVEKERVAHQCTMMEMERALLESEAKQIKHVEKANVGTQAPTLAQPHSITESHSRYCTHAAQSQLIFRNYF